jgi:hypothetical protein
MTATTTAEAVIAEMKAKASAQTTRTLCEALFLLAALPGSEQGRMARAVTLDVLCERHPEANAAAKAWAEDRPAFVTATLDAAVTGAALAAIVA